MATLPEVVFVLGGPGSGKGTQCALISENFGFVHLSAGELLRQEQAKEESKVGQLIDEHIRNGTIVPVSITCGLLDQAMRESGKTKFLIDGFPRNEDNLMGWNEAMEGKAVVKLVLFFDCPHETCIERCLGRGAAGSGRTDDNLDSLRKRLDTFVNSSLPIVAHYEKMNIVRKVDAVRPPEKVFEDVKKCLLEMGLVEA